MKRFYLFLVITCSVVFNLQGQYEHLLNKTFGQRYQYMSPLYLGKMTDSLADSIEVFREISTIAKMAAEKGDDDLLLECKLLELHYYYYRNRYSQAFFTAKAEELIDEAAKKNKTWLIAMVENALAMYNRVHKQYEKAFEHFHLFYDISKNLDAEELPNRLAEYCIFGTELYRFRDYETAIFYLKEALKDSLIFSGKFYYINCINTLGMCYRSLGKLDSSSYYFSLAYENALKKNSKAWEGISSGNLGENYFIQKLYEKAKPLLQKDADISMEFGDAGLTANALTILASINLEEKNSTTAEKQLVKARHYAFLSGQYKRFLPLYTALSKFHLLKGDIAAGMAFSDSASFVRDSLEKEFNMLHMMRGRQKVDLDRHRMLLAQLENEKTINILQRNALIVIGSLILIIGFFIYDRQRRRYRLKNEQLLIARKELNWATKELDNFTRNITEKNKLIEDLRQQVEEPAAESIRQLQRSTILTDEQWNDFRELFDKVHAGYLTRLKNKLPGLTPAETRFVALIKLKLSGKEMASMLGVGTDAVRQYRSRLRKKLSLGEAASLEDWLEGI